MRLYSGSSTDFVSDSVHNRIADKLRDAFSRGELPAKISRIDLGSGEREVVREISPLDKTGVEGIANIRMTPDGKALTYSYYQRMSRMYTVEGLF